MRLAWLTDLHLNFLDPPRLRRFLDRLAATEADAWLLGGDLGEAGSLTFYLETIAGVVSPPAPVCFVLGNHDYYGSSIAEVRQRVLALTRATDRLLWLTATDVVALGDDVALVGDDGWADARFGDPLGSTVELNDFYLIAELAGLPREHRIHRLNRLGDEAAARLAPKLARAAGASREVVVLTHVPPFHEAAWHQGRPSDPEWAPWFACRAVGEAILGASRAHPETRFLVLCGHTHSPGVITPAANVAVHTGRAVYGAPRIQQVFEIAHGQKRPG